MRMRGRRCIGILYLDRTVAVFMKYPALPDEGIDSQVVRQEQAIRSNNSGGVFPGLLQTVLDSIIVV